jgi:DNA (cytosine-5)-methyltransferase 1
MPKDDATLSAASDGSAMRYASVCDGIGAAHVAWQPLGWQCQWTSEIEPFPAAVVEHHYGFRNLGDMTAITEEMLDAPVELLVGGTPCQSFSVAGLRGGLADPRGNLALRFVQLAAVMQPKWIVWENVPGVLSSGKGRDFGTFLGALGELGYGFAYRVLDAQWFGVAQRRRRVFVVGYLGDWRRAAAVLFERESVFGNPPTRGATGQGITSSPQGIAGNVSSKWAKGTGGPAGDECYNLIAFQGGSQQDQVLGGSAVCPALCHSSNGNKGHHQPKVVVPFTKAKRAQSTTDDETWVPGEVSPTMSCFDQGDTRATTVVAYDVHGTLATKGASQTDCHTALRSRPPGQSEASTTTVVAFTTEQTPKFKDDCALTMTKQSPSGGGQPQCVATQMAVRRLTPRECERLQGFSDDFTAIQYRGKPAADGPRYRALGNSMAVPVMRWIGERIQQVDRL